VTGELAVIERLEDTADVTDIVEDRIYELILPQSETRASIVVQVVSDPKSYHLRGPDDLSRTRVQVDAYVSLVPVDEDDDPPQTLANLESAIDETLSGQTFNTAGSPGAHVTGILRVDRRTMRDPDERQLLRTMLDYVVWWKPL
jgi:hypothetical protein